VYKQALVAENGRRGILVRVFSLDLFVRH